MNIKSQNKLKSGFNSFKLRKKLYSRFKTKQLVNSKVFINIKKNYKAYNKFVLENGLAFNKIKNIYIKFPNLNRYFI